MFGKKGDIFDPNKVLRIRNSRKIYLPFYVMAIILVGILVYIFFLGLPLSRLGLFLIIIFIIIGIKITEIHRIINLYEINPESFVHTFGIFGKTVENIDFLAVSHLEVGQSLWQRFLRFGDVDIRVFGRENTTFVRNINKPFEFVRFFEDRVNEKRDGKMQPPLTHSRGLHITRKHRRNKR
ncbi:MAG: PH domain-containing protein [Candidatus Nanoarchaeia archaeon]